MIWERVGHARQCARGGVLEGEREEGRGCTMAEHTIRSVPGDVILQRGWCSAVGTERTETHGGCHAAVGLHAGRRPARGLIRGIEIASTLRIPPGACDLDPSNQPPPRFAR